MSHMAARPIRLCVTRLGPSILMIGFASHNLDGMVRMAIHSRSATPMTRPRPIGSWTLSLSTPAGLSRARTIRVLALVQIGRSALLASVVSAASVVREARREMPDYQRVSMLLGRLIVQPIVSFQSLVMARTVSRSMSGSCSSTMTKRLEDEADAGINHRCNQGCG